MIFTGFQKNIIKFTLLVSIVFSFAFGSFCAGMLHKTFTPTAPVSSGISPATSEHCCGDSMTVFQHIQSSINIFLATSRDLGIDYMFFLLSILSGFLLLRSSIRDIQEVLSSTVSIYFSREYLYLFDPLKLAFSDGILNTKLY